MRVSIQMLADICMIGPALPDPRVAQRRETGYGAQNAKQQPSTGSSGGVPDCTQNLS
jgi:hypothetical protein